MQRTKPLILVFPFNLLSHYLRCCALVKKYYQDYDVRFVQSDNYDEFVLQESFGTFSALHFDSIKVMKAVRQFDFSWLNETALQAIFESQVDAITRLQPVAVIGDNSPTLKMAAEVTGVKFVSVMNGYMSKYYDGIRKLSRTHYAFKLLKNFPRAVVNELTKVAEREFLKTIHAPFAAMRKKHNLKFAAYYPDELEGDLNLICDLEELFPQKNLPENYKIIGPLLYSSNRVVGLEDMLCRGKKNLFVSMGSSGDWESVRFLNGDEFRRYNIITAGDKEKVLKNSNIYAFEFLALSEVLPLVDAVICHGGNGTIYHSLLHHVPLLCLPAHFEQEWNVDAIEQLKLGRDLTHISDHKQILSVIEQSSDRRSELANHPLVRRLHQLHSFSVPNNLLLSHSE